MQPLRELIDVPSRSKISTTYELNRTFWSKKLSAWTSTTHVTHAVDMVGALWLEATGQMSDDV